MARAAKAPASSSACWRWRLVTAILARALAALEGPGGLLADVAGAEHQHAAASQVAEDLEREIHRHAGHADLALADGGMGAHMLGGLEGFLENPVEHRSRGAPRLRRGVGVLHLAEDFRLADHLRVDAGGDLEEVLDGGAVVQLEPDLFEHARVHLVAARTGRPAGGPPPPACAATP